MVFHTIIYYLRKVVLYNTYIINNFARLEKYRNMSMNIRRDSTLLCVCERYLVAYTIHNHETTI